MGSFLIAGAVVIIDQVIKAIALTKLASAVSVPAIGKIVSLTLVKNTGAAFGLFKYQTPAFISSRLTTARRPRS